jgi:hypothetical protein
MAAKSWSLSTPADDALKNTVPGLIRDVKEHAFTASGFYAEQQSTPDDTIAIYAGIVYFGITKVEYAGLDIVDLGTGGGFETTALTASYYNKVLFTINSSGTLEATEGTEHAVLASVVEPAIPAGKFPICMVSVQDDGTATAGTILTIEQSEIQQLQGVNSIDIPAGTKGQVLQSGGAAAANTWVDKPNRNAIINGDFNIWQRGTSFAALNGYAADRFTLDVSSDAVLTASRDTDVPTQSESGHLSNYSLKADVTTADTDIVTTQIVRIRHVIEGYNFAPFVGKTATLSFWVKAVKTGIYCVSFVSSGLDRSYVAEYTINSASTWEKKTITLTFDYSGGTWDYTNGIGLRIQWALAIGPTYQGIADTWNSAEDMSTSNQVNGVDSTDNLFWLSQVQLEEGTVATAFEYRDYGTELAMCQRYFKSLSGSSNSIIAMGQAYSTTGGRMSCLSAPMRVAPTLSYSALSDFYVTTAGYSTITPTTLAIYVASETLFGLDIAIGSASFAAGNAFTLACANTSARLNFSSEL